MKTQNEILTDFYNVVKASPIEGLSGGIYKKIRPAASILEDCVINIFAGVNGKFLQDGALSIKIFYLDIQDGASYFEDTVNGQAKELLLYNLSETLIYHTKGYSFYVDSRETYTDPVLEENQHYAIMKINFKLTKN